MLSMVLSLVGGTFQNWLSGRQEIEQKKAVARIENVGKGIPGYSDEFLIFVWSYPSIACFVPFLEESARRGIENFNAMPEWYQLGFITISMAVFGIDKVFRFKK